MRGGIWVMRDGQLVDKATAGPPPQAGIRTGRGAACISDTMDALKHPGTGRMLDSKSEFRRDTRASGCLEVGTDPSVAREKPRHTVSTGEVAADVKRAIQELNSR